MDSDTIQEILRLSKDGMGKRAMARKFGCNVKTVRRILAEHGETAPPVPQEPPPESKLAPYYDSVSQKAKQGLTGTRILRELKEIGYTGGRSILTDYLRKIRGAAKEATRTFRRFETPPAQEGQVDWSPYRIMVGGAEVVAHCFIMILCYSRYLFLQFHRDERLPTLLAAHVDAFAFFQGVVRTLWYDNMTTITFGRRGREILWNPVFLKFAQHYAFEPHLCRPRDPNRKGKAESIFRLIAQDFVRGRSFESWEHLDREAAAWLKEIANRRRHATTRQVPEEAWFMERDFLTALPETPYPTYREEIRQVYDDGTIPVDGTRYSVPIVGAGRARRVTVRVHPRHIEILNQEGQVIAAHRKPDLSGGLVLNKEHYEGVRRPRPEAGETERRFLALFPAREDFLGGLKRRMKTLAGVHMAELLRLTQVYGREPVGEALERVSAYGNWSVYAVLRILRDRFPLLAPDIPSEGTLSEIPMHPPIDDVETGSIEEYGKYTTGEPSAQTDDQERKEEA
jgi:transposase